MCYRRFVAETDAGNGHPIHDRTAWLRGGGNRCLVPPPTPRGKTRRIVMLGSPVVCSNVRVELLCEELGICHLAVSDVIHSAIRHPETKPTPAVQNALDYLQRGDAVPNETILNLIGERLGCLHCAGGFLLEGFPRTVAQAKALEQSLENHGVALTAVLNYVLPGKAAVETYCPPIDTLIEFYQQRGLLLTLDASGTFREIRQRTMASTLFS